VLETEAGNASPAIEVFAYGEYDLPLDWSGLRRVIDVGAHIGSFALWACARAPQVRVISVEPEPQNFTDLVANIGRNDLGTRVEALQAALGIAPGTVTLRIPMNREAGSTFATTGDAVHAVVVTLPELLARFDDAPDLLKLDCEGAEWQVFDELDDSSWGKVSRLVMECHATAERTVEEMSSLLELHGLQPTILSRRASGVSWCDEVAMIWAERDPTAL
jgi:FkbM family methyltransferase